jgi:hypothetical protein
MMNCGKIATRWEGILPRAYLQSPTVIWLRYDHHASEDRLSVGATLCGRPFFIPCGNAAKRLVAAHQPLNLVALAVTDPVEGAGAMFIRLPGNGDPDTMAPHILPNLTTALCLVAHNAVWPVFWPACTPAFDGAASHQLGKEDRFMPLTRRQQQRQERTGTFVPEVDFRAEVLLAPPQRFGLGIPFLAPAAC